LKDDERFDERKMIKSKENGVVVLRLLLRAA
jgi:hypothetical protein